MSETPAKMAVDDDVGEGTHGEPTSAEQERASPEPLDITEKRAQEEPSMDETVTEPGAKDKEPSKPPPTPPPSTEEPSSPRVMPRIPRATPPRPRPSSRPPSAHPTHAGLGPRIAGTRTVKLPTPDVVAARSEEVPSTEPSLTDADGTAATRPFEVDDTTATMRSRRRPGARDEEEDGPTLIAAGRYPAPQRDDEATLVQPIARPGSQPHLESPFSEPRPEYSKTSEFDVEQNSARPSPPPIPPSPSIISHGALSQRLAERELAVQAALAAASGFTEDEMARAARRNRHATTGAMVLLGAGMVLGALYGYLSSHALADGGSAATSASYASLTVLTTIALFFAGTAPLQRSTELKIAMVVMSALVLLFTLVRMLTIALG